MMVSMLVIEYLAVIYLVIHQFLRPSAASGAAVDFQASTSLWPIFGKAKPAEKPADFPDVFRLFCGSSFCAQPALFSCICWDCWWTPC